VTTPKSRPSAVTNGHWPPCLETIRLIIASMIVHAAAQRWSQCSEVRGVTDLIIFSSGHRPGSSLLHPPH
jgi:hypothetical protein